ncbi:DNA-binding protein [Stenotrophomonas rhizophila]
MARGITESDVHTAADELVASGERPTVERIRGHLGTGSPNTVTRWLETWWKNLGTRLQPERPDLKDAPAALAEIAGQWWALALQHAREAALVDLAEARRELSAEREEHHRQQEELEKQASEIRSLSEAADLSEKLATARATELQRVVEQLHAQIGELKQQLKSSHQRVELLEAARDSLDARVQEVQELARSERESFGQYVRSAEDRALRDVDQARQEVRLLQAQLAATVKKHAGVEADLRHAVERAQAAASSATAEADNQRGRSAALEEQLARLQSLPAEFEAALRRNQQAQKSPKKASKRAKKATPKAP